MLGKPLSAKDVVHLVSCKFSHLSCIAYKRQQNQRNELSADVTRRRQSADTVHQVLRCQSSKDSHDHKERERHHGFELLMLLALQGGAGTGAATTAARRARTGRRTSRATGAIGVRRMADRQAGEAWQVGHPEHPGIRGCGGSIHTGHLMRLSGVVRGRLLGVDVRMRPQLEDQIRRVDDQEDDRGATGDGEDGTIGLVLVLRLAEVQGRVESGGDDDRED